MKLNFFSKTTWNKLLATAHRCSWLRK